MLIEPNTHLFLYVVARDFGFAPNPFHGICTLATCKPGIRKSAKVGDWILGVGGKELGSAHKKCIFLMKVTEKIGFEDYWRDERFRLKKPIRNGSKVMMLGDNIYHRDETGDWIQEDSHHSNSDGSPNPHNIKRDTSNTDQVLISEHFLYFGSDAVSIDLDSVNYTNGVGFKKLKLEGRLRGIDLIKTLVNRYRCDLNTVISDPCQFSVSHQRVDQRSGKIS
ncbi:hypothetical protein MYE70_05940 [Marinobacter alexandrii]|uniref:Nmad2 family putative nucleotide modification protein n=1 Tax=Marinobacter alexandrii TaxID=2570351 RepID=UPI001FFF35C1|nr:hypothetical protein [Marinobacter alexandrii]MCK2148603.1 hypothetical protein [Marinobacter alexandrii]